MVLSAALFALFLSRAALAAEPPAPTATPSPSRTLVGEVLSVDVANRKVTVVQGLEAHGHRGPAKRETVTVHVPFSTPLRRGKRAASLTDIRPKDQAVVRYRVTPSGAQAFSLTVADLATPTPTPEAGRS